MILKLIQLIFFVLITHFSQSGFAATETREKETSPALKDSTVVPSDGKTINAFNQDEFLSGEHYVVLEKPVATRDSSKIEVVEMFSYGCPHCFEFEPLIKAWAKKQASDTDFWFFPAIWNESMQLFARAFYTAQHLNITDQIHIPLFTAILIKQKKLSKESELADFFAEYGVDKKSFTEAFSSINVENQVKRAKERVNIYNPAGVPEIIVNGKYRIDRLHAGGMKKMLAVADYLINKERLAKDKK